MPVDLAVRFPPVVQTVQMADGSVRQIKVVGKGRPAVGAPVETMAQPAPAVPADVQVDETPAF